MNLDINNIPGRAFHRAFVVDHINPALDVSARGRVPGRKFLANYWVTLSNGDRWLVLYFYGNDALPEKIEQRLIGKDKYTLAVREKDGLVAYAGAEVRKYRGKNQTYLNLVAAHDEPGGDGQGGQNNIYLPRAYRKRIEELMRKRPYCIEVCAHMLLAFVDHEASYNDLQGHLTYTLSFNAGKITYACGGWTAEKRLRQ